MNSKLIETEPNYVFYCNNCKSQFSFIYTFIPTNNSKEYYVCNRYMTLQAMNLFRNEEYCAHNISR